MATAFSNAYAPEHLELHLADAADAAAAFTSAGAVFVGDQTPVSLGDYMAGSNTCFRPAVRRGMRPVSGPTRSCARSRSSRMIARRCQSVRAGVVALAETEVLPAHGEAIEARFTA